MITRRSFLGSILAASVAPAIVSAKSLMPTRLIQPVSSGSLLSNLFPPATNVAMTGFGPYVAFFDVAGKTLATFPLVPTSEQNGVIRLDTTTQMTYTANSVTHIGNVEFVLPSMGMRKPVEIPGMRQGGYTLCSGESFTVVAPDTGMLELS